MLCSSLKAAWEAAMADRLRSNREAQPMYFLENDERVWPFRSRMQLVCGGDDE